MKQKRKKMGRTLLSFLLTLAMVIGLMPGIGLTAKADTTEWLVGENIDLSFKWIILDDKEPNSIQVGANGKLQNIEYNGDRSQWKLSGCVDCGDIYLTSPVGKTSSDVPSGFKIKSGDGTQDNPYAFELVYSSDTQYLLWVGGKRVTSKRLSGEGWTYDADNKVLTLNNYDGRDQLIEAAEDLTICLEGNNTIIGTDTSYSAQPAIYVYGNLTFEGTGTLTAQCAWSNCIHAKDIIFNGGTVKATSENNTACFAEGNLMINDGSTVTAGGMNGIHAGSGLTILGGTVNVNCDASGGNSDCRGINSHGQILIKGGNTTISITGEESKGIFSQDGYTSLTIENGSISASARGNKSIGIYGYGGVTIKNGNVIASGEGQAIQGSLANEITGTFWKDVDGTTGEGVVSIGSGRSLPSLIKKVVFTPPADVTAGGNVDVTDAIEVTLSLDNEGDMVTWDDQTANMSSWQISGRNSDYYWVCLQSTGATQAAGTYSWSQMQNGYNVLMKSESETVHFTDCPEGCTVTVDGKNVNVSGFFKGDDGKTYDVNITYNPAAVTGVTLDKASAVLNEGDTISLKATVNPVNAGNKFVKWNVVGDWGIVELCKDPECTNPIDSTMPWNAFDPVYVRGCSKGDVTITATSDEDSALSASCSVTVKRVKPTTAYADYLTWDDDTEETLPGKIVTFNERPWYLIADDSESATKGTVTLYAADSGFGVSAYSNEGSLDYSTSTIKGVLDELTTTGDFKDVADAIVTNTEVGGKLYLLSFGEHVSIKPKIVGKIKFTGGDCSSSSGYWLRSAYEYFYVAYGESNTISPHGVDDNYLLTGKNVAYQRLGVRPALKLDLSKVMFDSDTNTFTVGSVSKDPVSYMAWDETEKKLVEKTGDDACKEYEVVTADTTAFEDGKWYVVSETVTNNNRISVEENCTANLILCDGATLTANKGITLINETTLNIYGQTNGTGTLEITETDAYNAAIGGVKRRNGGIVNIHGGIVTAHGGNGSSPVGGGAAGIGGGGGDDSSSGGGGGTVNIYGGTVTANGGSSNEGGGAGIGGGGGGNSSNGGSGGTVNIYDGTVTANGGSSNGGGAAGIGGGDRGDAGGTAGAAGTLTLGAGLSMSVSTDNSTWSAYDGSTRAQYMKTGSASTKAAPAVNDFTYTAPDTYPIYDGTAKTATVVPKEGVTGMGNVTVKYFSDTECTAELVGRPTDVGTYYVGITVEEGTSYSAVSDVLHDASWQFTINRAMPSTENFTYSAPSDLTYDGNAKTATVVGASGMGQVTVKYFSDPECTAELVGRPTDAGTYYVGVTTEEGDNYSAVSTVLHDASWQFTINKQAAPASLNADQKPTANTGLTYTGNEQELVTAPTNAPTGYTVQYSLDGTNWSTELPKGTNAGDYTVKVKYVGDNNHEDFDGTDITVTIGKGTAPTLTDDQKPTANTGLTYTGNEQELVTAPTELPVGYIEMQYALGDANGATQPYTTSIPTATEAGTYYVWYKVVGDANHGDIAAQPVTVTIAKAANPVTVSLEGWTYGDTAKTPVVDATYGKDTAVCTYSTSADGTYVSEKPVNAGTYYVKAAIAESDNYSAAESDPVSFTIAPKALTDAMLTLDAVSYEHDGNEKTPTITVKDGTVTLTADTDYTVENSSTTSSAAYGTYKIKVNGINNYTGSVEKEWKILDHTNPAAEIKIEENTFNTVLNTITFGLFFNKTETVTITATDAGSGVAKIEYLTSTVSATTREAIDALTGTWKTVNKSTASFSEDPEKKFIVYAKVTDVAGNVTYVTSEGVVLDTTAPVIKVDDALPVTEYNRAVSWAATDENLKNVVITFTAEGATTGAEVYDQATTGEQTGLYGQLSDIGSYTIKATDKAGNPKEVTFAITERDAVITGGADSITYEAGTTYDLSQLFTVEDGVTIDTYEVVANADTSVEAGAGTITGSALTVTRAGLMTIKATVAEGQTSAATPEYIKKTTATGTLTVSRVAGSVGISISDVVYGNPFTVGLNSTNAGVTPEIKYTMTADATGNEIPAASQTESTDKPVNAGTYKVVVSYPASALYNAVSAETTFKITPAVLTVTAEAKEKTYGDADPALTYTVSGLAYKDTKATALTGALTRAEGENAGTYAIAQGTLAANANYIISYTGEKLTINKAEMADKTVADTIVVISAGVKDATINLTEYLENGAKLENAETTGDLGEYITPEALADGTFTYSVAKNDGKLTGSIVLTVSSTNYQNYTITINLTSAKRITEVVVESEDVKETAVKTVEVPALEDFTEAQPEAAVEVKMEVKLESEETVGKEVGTAALAKIKDAIAKAFGGVAGSDLAQEYLDITITKSVNGGAAQEISDMNRVMEIAVSYDLTGKYNPVVIREHGGSVSQFTKLSSRSAAGNYRDGTFYVDGSGKSSTIFIYARYFSVYTIAYTTASSYQVTYDDATADASKDIQSNVDQVIVATGAKAVKPADPKRDGYDFDGWYIEGTKTKWNFDNAVTGDIRLVAHWDDDDDDEKDDTAAVAATPAAPAAQPRSPKTSDNLMSYAFWLLLAAAGAGVCLVSAKGRKKEQDAE
ncbi:MAG: InlB B-repeat-containing protein [Lachnospiraceae bacterium]|nr:InlB B-repeat-containing protein [Lachnospiraceae bacterium]